MTPPPLRMGCMVESLGLRPSSYMCNCQKIKMQLLLTIYCNLLTWFDSAF